jgi:hypothetical protein
VVEVSQKQGTFSLNIWLRHEWRDDFFKWQEVDQTMVENEGCDPTLWHANESSLRFRTGDHKDPVRTIWYPDILLYNTAEYPMGNLFWTDALVESSGRVTWSRPGVVVGTCDYHPGIGSFPNDAHDCTLEFGSWTYPKVKMVIIGAVRSRLLEKRLGRPTKDLRGTLP